MKLDMSTKIILIAFFLFTLSLGTGSELHAKRLLPRAQAQKSDIKTGKAPTRGVNVSVKFREDRNAIIVNFTNLSIASSVSYVLSYNVKSGVEQAASGSISLPATEPVVRELLFGTCSKGVCRYDTGINNAKFVVTTVLKSGKKVIKTFRLKV